jgi:sortase A
MKRKLGIALMLLGLLLLAGSVGLLIFNQLEADRAEAVSQELLPAVSEAIAQQQPQEPQPTLPLPTEPAAPRMKAVEVDGHLCVGYLSIPRLKLELPVLAECTDANLKISPCLFTGTTMEDDLTIAGHNYRRHFGPIRRLKPGNDVIFVDMDGNVIHYQVAAVDAVSPTAAEEVTSGQFDLALITCTYGGKTRLVIYCDRQ